MSELNVLYDNLERERAKRHWTIVETAEKLGISEKQYRNRLANAQNIKATDLIRCTQVFGVSADYLLGITG